jgi:hypothetical protein
MWWLLVFVVLAGLVILLYIRTEGLTREHKRLLVQHKMLEQDHRLMQQYTYELAEEFSQALLQQLSQARRMTRMQPDTLAVFEICLQAIPVMCKELSSRQQSVAQALQRFLKMHSELTLAQAESEFTRHGRLVNYWQQQSFAGYLQMCQQMVSLVRDNAHKESFRPTEAAS